MPRVDWEQVYQLWDELSDFGAVEVDRAHEHCLKRLSLWLGADNAFWIGAVRVMAAREAKQDPLSGWRGGALQLLHAGAVAPGRRKVSMKRLNNNDPGDTSMRLAAQAGAFRSYRLRDNSLVDFKTFRQTEHYDFFYRQLGVNDRLWVVIPVSPEAECYYCFDKFGRRRFSKQDLELASRVMRGIKWFHRQLLLSHGLGIAESRLTPTDRRVMKALVTGATRKELAELLGVTTGTAHQYTHSLYRKFGVRSKAELLALWLNQ